MGKLIEYKVNGDTYVVFGEYAGVDAEVFEPAELDYVLRNGSQMESFGETWAGASRDESDVLGRAIASFVNDDSSIEIVEVCDQIRDFKARVQSYSHEVKGRKVPDVVVTSYGDVAELIAISETGAYYVNEESNVFIATRSDGSLATNYEAFFESALMEDFEKGQMIFMTDVLRENLQEDVLTSSNYITDTIKKCESLVGGVVDYLATYKGNEVKSIVDGWRSTIVDDMKAIFKENDFGADEAQVNRVYATFYAAFDNAGLLNDALELPAEEEKAVKGIISGILKGKAQTNFADKGDEKGLRDDEIEKISNALLDECAIYDKANNLVYITDVSGEPETLYGIQVYTLRIYGKELADAMLKTDCKDLTGFCLGCIPAPGSAATNEWGFSKQYDCGDATADYEKMRENLRRFVQDEFEGRNFKDFYIEGTGDVLDVLHDRQEAHSGDVEILHVERPRPELQKELDCGVVHFRDGNRSGYGLVPMELLGEKTGPKNDKVTVAALIKKNEFELPDLSSQPYYSDVSPSLLHLYDLERQHEPGGNIYSVSELEAMAGLEHMNGKTPEAICEEIEADIVLYPALASSIEIVRDENIDDVNIHLTDDFRSCIADHYPSERYGRMAAIRGDIPGERIFEQVECALDVVAERNTQLIPNGGEVERTLKEALKDFENLSGQEVLISLKHEAETTGKRKNSVVLYGTMKYETQKDRQEAYKWAKKWLNKSAKDLDHELSKRREKNKEQGR